MRSSGALKQGNAAVNRLKVVVRGPEMTFFVNGQQVDRAVDAQFTRGRFAFYVAGGVSATFDDFKVTAPR